MNSGLGVFCFLFFPYKIQDSLEKSPSVNNDQLSLVKELEEKIGNYGFIYVVTIN